MAVNREIIAQHVVILAKSINAGAFSQYWFIKNEIFNGEEFLEDSVFAPGLTVVSTKECQLAILPDQIRFALKVDNLEEGEAYAVMKLKPFIVAMEHVKVDAIGFNYIWKIEDPNRDVKHLSRDFFHHAGTPIGNYFSKDDACYGVYLSQDLDDMTRLKLDVKPVTTDVEGNSVTFMMASFNYHADIMDALTSKDVMLNQLSKWRTFINNSKAVACLLK